MTYVTIEKAPTEDYLFEFDFAKGDLADLLESDPIDEAACTVKDWADAALSGITVGTPAKSTTEPTVLQIRISGGSHGIAYQIKLKAVTRDTDQDAECFILCQVRRPTAPA